MVGNQPAAVGGADDDVGRRQRGWCGENIRFCPATPECNRRRMLKEQQRVRDLVRGALRQQAFLQCKGRVEIDLPEIDHAQHQRRRGGRCSGLPQAARRGLVDRLSERWVRVDRVRQVIQCGLETYPQRAPRESDRWRWRR